MLATAWCPDTAEKHPSGVLGTRSSSGAHRWQLLSLWVSMAAHLCVAEAAGRSRASLVLLGLLGACSALSAHSASLSCAIQDSSSRLCPPCLGWELLCIFQLFKTGLGTCLGASGVSWGCSV